jgi:hypothetical protein
MCSPSAPHASRAEHGCGRCAECADDDATHAMSSNITKMVAWLSLRSPSSARCAPRPPTRPLLSFRRSRAFKRTTWTKFSPILPIFENSSEISCLVCFSVQSDRWRLSGAPHGSCDRRTSASCRRPAIDSIQCHMLVSRRHTSVNARHSTGTAANCGLAVL